MNPDLLADGLLWYVVFVFSTTCHEAAHALVAKWGGDLTAFHGGQVTLNPLPHIKREPFGMVLFPLITFATSRWMMGWASAPYDPRWEYRYPHRAARMALAGPAANFLICIAAGIAIRLGIWCRIFMPPEAANFGHMVDPLAGGAVEALAKLLSLFFSLNLLLGVFNLIPLPPLDGASAAGLLVPEDTARSWVEKRWGLARYAMIGLFIAWQFGGALYSPMFSFALRLLYPTQHYG